MKIKHIDPSTFVETELELDDMHWNIAEILNDATKGIFNVTQVFPTDNTGNKLVFGITGNREPGQPPAKKFRIIVEKVDL